MSKTLLPLVLTLIVGQAMAMESMELAIDAQHNMPNTAEQKVVILVQDQETELPVRYSSLSSTLKNLVDDLAEAHKEGIPLPEVSLATWQLLEPQLERVYRSTQGDNQSRDDIDDIIADYNHLDGIRLIDLLKAQEYLDIPLLREITLELAQNKLTLDEILQLSPDILNEVIKRKALKIAGPVVLKELAVFGGHQGWVNSVCVTPDNKIVSGSSDKTVRIFTMNGKQLAVCLGHEDDVWSVCVTHDNKIISGSEDTTVRIWNRDGQELAVCRGHEGPVRSVCITPDNKIVSSSFDRTVRIWNMNGQELAVCRGHTERVWSVCVTPDNEIISGSDDATIRVWDIDGNQLAVCQGHDSSARPVSVTRDNKIVSISSDRTVRIWDMNGRELAVHRDNQGPIYITPDNKIISWSDDNTVRIWDMNGQELAVCRGHTERVWSVCVTPDNKIISGSWDGTVRIWNMNGQELAVCLSGSLNNPVRTWEIDGQRMAIDSDAKNWVHSICVTHDNKIVSCYNDSTIRVWDMNRTTLHNRLSGMSAHQAEAIGKILQLATNQNLEKEQIWKEIAEVFGEEELPNLSKWRSARAIKLLILPVSFLIAVWVLDLWKKQKEQGKKENPKILEEQELVSETQNEKES